MHALMRAVGERSVLRGRDDLQVVRGVRATREGPVRGGEIAVVFMGNDECQAAWGC
jgi:hypothetical protein